ncbi:MAG: glycerol-3-phosphate 1-O-acyltransferase PlsY [Candidatus Rokubacteria bacterium]|nr:glycerol-3-phosphate 1-O-acyltransferase PlsY [Candidatus Rokubacteria bacterium]
MSGYGILALVAAYLIGAVPIGLLVARLTGGVDIRRHGSGNIGATNVLRTMGRGPAIVTLLGDVAKGFAAVSLVRALVPDPAWSAAGAVAALAGNCWSIFLRGRGGKGVATGTGAFLAVAPWAVAVAGALFLLVTGTSRYVSLGSVLAAAALPVATAALGYPGSAMVGAAVAATVIAWRHRENLARLARGTERRLGGRAGAA